MYDLPVSPILVAAPRAEENAHRFATWVAGLGDHGGVTLFLCPFSFSPVLGNQPCVWCVFGALLMMMGLVKKGRGGLLVPNYCRHMSIPAWGSE